MGHILELWAPSTMGKITPKIMGEGREKWSAKMQKGRELQLALIELLKIT